VVVEEVVAWGYWLVLLLAVVWMLFSKSYNRGMWRKARIYSLRIPGKQRSSQQRGGNARLHGQGTSVFCWQLRL
jgi:hypothetical protein